MAASDWWEGAKVYGGTPMTDVFVAGGSGYSYTKPTVVSHNVEAERDRWKAKCEYWQGEVEKRGKTRFVVDATKVADEIMARIERDGAIHKDALVDVVRAFGGPGPAPAAKSKPDAPYNVDPGSWDEVAQDGSPIIDASKGVFITDAIERGITLASIYRHPITVRFNSKLFRCSVGDTAKQVLDRTPQ